MAVLFGVQGFGCDFFSVYHGKRMDSMSEWLLCTHMIGFTLASEEIDTDDRTTCYTARFFVGYRTKSLPYDSAGSWTGECPPCQ
jgi:hypothetical protein